jgi:hypothetical protein
VAAAFDEAAGIEMALDTLKPVPPAVGRGG